MSLSILIAAGGTGGHMIPAHALSEELQQRGHNVVAIDRAPGSGASHAAAGMLAAAGEAWHGETEMWDLGVRSARLWPEYATSLGVPLHRTGTLLVGHDAGHAGRRALGEGGRHRQRGDQGEREPRDVDTGRPGHVRNLHSGNGND